MKIKVTIPITIIPAQPGWFVATTVEGSDRLDKEAVIAWAIQWDKDSSAYVADPITYNTPRNNLFYMVAGYLVCQLHGMIVAANREGKHMPLYSEPEAVEWSKRVMTQRAVEIIRECDRSPEEPESR